jgi:hypothetical protein
MTENDQEPKEMQVRFPTMDDRGLQLVVALQSVIDSIGRSMPDDLRQSAIRYIADRHLNERKDPE